MSISSYRSVQYRCIFYNVLYCALSPIEFNCSLTYDKCTGGYSCSPAGISDPVSCSVTIPRKVAPPPNICTENSFGCEYYNPCKAWNKGCFGVDYQCTLESVYKEYNKTHQKCVPFNPLPPPKEECLFIDNKCQWYNECAMWLSDTGYQCGTTIDKYIYTHSLIENNDSIPPGECINQLGTCTWSSKFLWPLLFLFCSGILSFSSLSLFSLNL